jgi:predicted DNA-binding protein (MmcQ/YjbR family)
VDAHRLLADLEAFALSLPGAWADTPWEDDQVSKVGTKIFVFWGNGETPGIGVKLPESNAHGLSLPGAAPSGYGLGRHGWVSIPLGGLDDGDAEVLFDFVEESYRAVAPKKLVKELDARAD